MDKQNHTRHSWLANWFYWFVGLGSLIWFLLRSGTKPRRLTYPCQRVALANSLGFIGYVVSLLGSVHLYRRLKQKISPGSIAFFAFALLFAICLQSSVAASTVSVYASPALPPWTSTSAISDVFGVHDIPAPRCSLDGGTLPSSPPCNEAEYALHDDGVDALIDLMEAKNTHFYETVLTPSGIIGSTDIVVIKINNQWGGGGSGDGVGRLSTNTDVLKGLIWRILQHPDNFSGEVVIVENAQPISSNDWNVTPANAQDSAQSIQDVVNTFQSQGYNVSMYNWTTLNSVRSSGASVGDSGYPSGEYIHGNMSDAYILLEDPDGTGTNELSYPKFRTANGNYTSMRYGVWNGSAYNSDRLTFINLPVLKRHCMAGATIAWKNLIGFITAEDMSSTTTRYGSWNDMHDFYWGYTGGTNRNYGLLGREIALVRAPDLHIVDAIWVANESNYQGNAIRQDVLLASTDPFAVDWYASEYVLRPLTGSQSSSAARSGTFRDATRTNQNAARSEWPGGSGNYPYMDLLDTYNGSSPSEDEKNEMNVYITSPGASSPTLTLQSPNGGETWTVGTQEEIRWASSGQVEDVRLEYSTDGFTSPQTIVGSTTNDGSYTWTIPNDPSDNVTVRVSSVLTSTINDTSDAAFTIASPALTLQSPNGGQLWLTNSSHQITWTSTGAIAQVKLSYSTDGFATVSHTIDTVPNTGAYTWTTPVTPSKTVRVRVANAADSTTYDDSDADLVLTDTIYYVYLPLILKNE